MKKSFSWRVFISFGLFIALLMMLVSGVILYISPPGRVANWTDWRMIGLTKRGWQNQHIIFGFSFLILSLFHLFFINWKAFLSYLKSKTSEGLKSPGELLTIIMLSFLFVIGTFRHRDILWYSALLGSHQVWRCNFQFMGTSGKASSGSTCRTYDTYATCRATRAWW